MKAYALEDLQFCHVKKCLMRSSVIVERNVGGTKVLLSYCDFHAKVAERFFQTSIDRKEIRSVTL